MNEQMNTPMLPPPSGVAEWFSVWKDAVTKPNGRHFHGLLNTKSRTNALLWIFLKSANFFLRPGTGQVTRQMMQNFGMEDFRDGWQHFARQFVVRLCLISVVLTALMIGIVQLIAKMFGGHGTFDQLAYAMAAILTPFSLISGVLTLLSAIPYVGSCFGIVSLLAGLYVLVLEIMAVKGVNQFGWGQAIASLLLPSFVLVCCIAVV
jgi:hypothetical protein